MALGIQSASTSDEPTTFVQYRFAIGFWIDPPADENMDLHYADISAANFTMVLGGFGAKIKETVPKQIDLCEKYDLKVVVDRAGWTPAKIPEKPVVWGYRIHDEPYARDFPNLRDVVAEIREGRPGKLSYINLFPSYASEQMLGTKTYDEHVRQFVDKVDINVLSMDHYPVITPNEDTRSSYCTNLAVITRAQRMNQRTPRPILRPCTGPYMYAVSKFSPNGFRGSTSGESCVKSVRFSNAI